MAEVLSAPATTHEPPAYFSPRPVLPQQQQPRSSKSQPDQSPLPSPAETRTPSPDRTPSPEYHVPSSQTSVSASPRGSFQYFSRSAIYSAQPGAVSDDNGIEDEEISFPTYDDSSYHYDTPSKTNSLQDMETYPSTPSNPPETPTFDDSAPSSPGVQGVVDDTAVRDEPSSQVDYLSHDWREEDIWASWKHIKSNRKLYGEVSRLENASWRTWTKSKYNLRTISPETLNWLKDCDVTWLYGPLQTGGSTKHIMSESTSELSKNNSFLHKKPILKKRSVSEVMLQKSLSSSSLIKQAAAAVQAQRSSSHCSSSDDARLSRTPSDFISSDVPMSSGNTAPNTSTFPSSPSSDLESPENGRRHIRFDNTVEQCIAVDFKEGIAEEESALHLDDESSDDGGVMMKTRSRKTPSNSNSRSGSFSQEGKGIAMLPSTTLKFHEEDPECQDHADGDKSFGSSWRSSRIPNSPSQETLRPPRPSANFLIGDEEDESDVFWEPDGAFGKSRSDTPVPLGRRSLSAEDEQESTKGLRRTPSGMFMPFSDEEDEEGFGSTGILGRAVDTVNTFRDIAHVIWNVGWRK